MTNQLTQPQPQSPPNARLMGMIAKYSFSGPIPPPEVIKKYEEAIPGSGNRIISMAENQSKHRQKLEQSVVSSNIHNEKIGMYLAFALTIVFMIIGAALVIFDKSVVGWLAIFGPGGFHVWNYLDKRRREDENKKKQEAKNEKALSKKHKKRR